jgi:Ni,Fe-hydrogenase III large subunit
LSPSPPSGKSVITGGRVPQGSLAERGDVVYWLMQDKMNGIYRCKVRDPSMLNRPTLSACALPRRTADGVRTETLVADFPLLNKSFSR